MPAKPRSNSKGSEYRGDPRGPGRAILVAVLGVLVPWCLMVWGVTVTW